MGTLIVCSLLSVVIALLVARPFFSTQEKPYFDPNAEAHVFDEKISLLETIQELEMDFRMGKLTREEFEALSNDSKRDYLKLKHQGDEPQA
ncbi:MAG: hypothetical protein RRB13_07195 [bacterium]|nr:hypothetical protein [bacterium]